VGGNLHDKEKIVVKTLGQVAYDAYFKKCDGKSLISGAELPVWDKQSPEIKQAWESAAEAVHFAVEEKLSNA
jgi:hypothetical protein